MALLIIISNSEGPQYTTFSPGKPFPKERVKINCYKPKHFSAVGWFINKHLIQQLFPFSYFSVHLANNLS